MWIRTIPILGKSLRLSPDSQLLLLLPTLAFLSNVLTIDEQCICARGYKGKNRVHMLQLLLLCSSALLLLQQVHQSSLHFVNLHRHGRTLSLGTAVGQAQLPLQLIPALF